MLTHTLKALVHRSRLVAAGLLLTSVNASAGTVVTEGIPHQGLQLHSLDTDGHIDGRRGGTIDGRTRDADALRFTDRSSLTLDEAQVLAWATAVFAGEQMFETLAEPRPLEPLVVTYEPTRLARDDELGGCAALPWPAPASTSAASAWLALLGLAIARGRKRA